ncbi:transglycosylase domain-containing protein [Methylocapsa palsarum]|uniref:Penicillin-binding protein 1A n=1 Tax=Methylocapsa palsarum TaxID=1612308 RepID=A0A1I3XTY3_9HYPH|nr:PBP1A family penicillin-binding protein [Methylocapsa palsarum]SFK22456.1 penicillin-binding protein 1A [Methylocapsa palsarum]
MFDGLRSSAFGRKIARGLLAFDAFVDSTLYAAQESARDRYDAFSTFMDRFHIAGWRRALNELACETLNISVGVGVLALMLAMPAFQETSEDWLKKTDLAVTFLDRYGQEAGRRGIRHDDSVSFDELPPALIQAVLATEDRRFFDHFGIDVIGTMRALTVNARADTVVQGGSSITQQLAKNLFLSNKRTLQRKIKEAFLALWLEYRLPKREILRLYLDRAYLGGGAFGVQAAAQFYFDKSVKDLSLAEAAMLAGLFKAPTKFAPHVNLPAARARANDVLNNMVDAGYLTEGQIYAALRNPATPVDRKRDVNPDWYLDYAYDEVKKLSDAGKLGDERVLTVRTALDLNLQRRADATIEDQLRQYGPGYHAKQGAMVILEPLGALRAMIGGRDYGASQFNRATDALRQPGSSFKPFVYLTALMTGKYKPTTIVVDAPICIGNWCPRNYKGSYAGSLPLITALAKSLNTVAIRLSIGIGEADSVPGHNNTFEAAKRGRAKIVETARRMGLTTPLADTVSLPIGAAEVTVIDMASAYCAFANGGLRAPPYTAVEIANSRGEVIYRRDRDSPPPYQIIDPDTIVTMDSMLLQVVEAGTGKRAKLDNIDVAGKTGTTNGYKDAWFIGFTGNFVGAVWFGNDDDTAMENMTGGSLPAGTWHEVMEYAHHGVELKPLPGRPTPAAAPNPAPVGEGATADSALAGAPRPPARLSARAVETLTAIEAEMTDLARKRSQAELPTVGASVKDVAGKPAEGRKGAAGGGG